MRGEPNLFELSRVQPRIDCVNIAEGSGRMSVKEKIHFLEISYGSLLEVLSQMDVACDLGYISQEEFERIENMEIQEAKLLSGLRSFFEKTLTSNP